MKGITFTSALLAFLILVTSCSNKSKNPVGPGETQEIQGITFLSIPGGTFQMGNVENEGSFGNNPIHTVTLSGFEMSAHEITNTQYADYLNAALSVGKIEVKLGDVYGKTDTEPGVLYLDMDFGTNEKYCRIIFNGEIFTVAAGYDEMPIVAITWYGAKAFALYYGLDLPTESEWEYACRGGLQYKYGTDDGTISSTKANYWPDGPKIPVAAGRYPANPFGLYDMSGNVFEWCNDWYGDYPGGPSTNPTGALTGSHKVPRGGSFTYSEFWSRSNCRFHYDPEKGNYDIGIRVVRRAGGVVY